jgi:hypothetical protein
MTTNDKQRVTLFLNPKLLKRAKVQAVIEDISLTVIVEKALIKYLPREAEINKKYIKKDYIKKDYIKK